MKFDKLKVEDVFVKDKLIIGTQITLSQDNETLDDLREVLSQMKGEKVTFNSSNPLKLQIIEADGYRSQRKGNVYVLFIKLNAAEVCGVKINDTFRIE